MTIDQGPDQQPSGSTVLLLHGIGGRASLWAPTIAVLSARHRVIAMDMPGYDGNSPALESFEAVADAAVALLDARGIAQADVVGHSMGGMIALEIAVRHPERVRRLVIVASSPAFASRDPDFREAFLASRMKPLDAGLGMAGAAMGLLPAIIGPAADPAATQAAIAAMGSVDERAYRTALGMLTGFDRRAELPRLTQPALLIAGDADATAPPRGMARMADAMGVARMIVIPGVGHLVPLEAPGAFHEAVQEFLDKD